MAGDLFGLSAADRDVLLRMIARERSNYSANVRNLAPVPREKNIWKPSSPLVWIALTEPLYPAIPSGTQVNRATGYLCEYDEPNQYWDIIYPYKEVTVEASSFSIAAPVWAVIACQKRGDVYEAVAGAPLEESTYAGFDGSRSGHGWTSYFGINGLEDTTSTTVVTKSAWLYPNRRTGRFYNGLYQAEGIELDTSATTPATNGNFDCLHSGYYEISLEVSGFTTVAWTGTPADSSRSIQEYNTGPASAGTAHTHTYERYHPGHYEPVLLQAKLWRKEGSGSYTEQSAGDGKQFLPQSVPIQAITGSGPYFNYNSRAYCNFLAGDRIGIQFVATDFMSARISVVDMHLNFRPMDLYTRSGLGAG